MVHQASLAVSSSLHEFTIAILDFAYSHIFMCCLSQPLIIEQVGNLHVDLLS